MTKRTQQQPPRTPAPSPELAVLAAKVQQAKAMVVPIAAIHSAGTAMAADMGALAADPAPERVASMRRQALAMLAQIDRLDAIVSAPQGSRN